MTGTLIIEAKDEVVFENLFWVAWHPILIDLVQWVRMTMLPVLPVVTSAYRVGDKGVHGTDPLRGIDIRSHDIDGKSVVDKINEHWQYDSSRPEMQCAILHNVGRGMHIHLQVHDSTCIVKGGWGDMQRTRFVKECNR